METITATILATVLITVAVIGLGAGIWAIVSLKRRVSKLEILGGGFQDQLNGVFREFELVGRNHDEKIKDVRNRISNIVATDVQCSNGVIHVLDKVLLPTF